MWELVFCVGFEAGRTSVTAPRRPRDATPATPPHRRGVRFSRTQDLKEMQGHLARAEQSVRKNKILMENKPISGRLLMAICWCRGRFVTSSLTPRNAQSSFIPPSVYGNLLNCPPLESRQPKAPLDSLSQGSKPKYGSFQGSQEILNKNTGIYAVTKCTCTRHCPGTRSLFSY